MCSDTCRFGTGWPHYLRCGSFVRIWPARLQSRRGCSLHRAIHSFLFRSRFISEQGERKKNEEIFFSFSMSVSSSMANVSNADMGQCLMHFKAACLRKGCPRSSLLIETPAIVNSGQQGARNMLPAIASLSARRRLRGQSKYRSLTGRR